MNAQDKKIQKLLKEIEKKRKALGERPDRKYKGSAVIQFFTETFNLNVMSLPDLIVLQGTLQQAVGSLTNATTQKGLGSNSEINSRIENFSDSIEDIDTAVNYRLWLDEDSKIKTLEKQLKELRSQEAKTEEQLNIIEDLIKG